MDADRCGTEAQACMGRMGQGAGSGCLSRRFGLPADAGTFAGASSTAADLATPDYCV
jgi:hypothetical protein